jgi:hypothetical protein
MTRFFTYNWQYKEARKEPQGEPLGHTWGSRFSGRKIEPGDRVYVVSMLAGRMYLLGSMQVASVVTKDEARRILGSEPYDAPEHLIAATCTPAHLIEPPIETVRELRFVSGSKRKALAFREGGVLNPQTLRGLRELDAESASRLDELLGEMMPFVPASGGGEKGEEPVLD